MADQHLTTSEEIWKPVPGFPGYEVSDHGRVRTSGHSILPGRRGENAANWKNGININDRGYRLIWIPHHHRANHHGYVFEHIIVAEVAMGKPVPLSAEIHHFGGNPSDNQKIIICQDHAYHRLLHKRQVAYEICGHAGWLKCSYCKKYDDPKNLYVFRRTEKSSLQGYHLNCRTLYQRGYRMKKLKVAPVRAQEAA